MRELDEALRMPEIAGVMIEDGRTGMNIRRELTGLLRQSVCAKLAGCEEMNDHE